MEISYDKSNLIKKRNGYSIFFLLFGILAPMPILNIFSITMYVWGILLLGIIALGEWIRKGGIRFLTKGDSTFLIVVGMWMVSYLICSFRMPTKWTKGILTSFIQLCFLVLIYIFFSPKNRVEYLVYYIKGVYISSIIQMVWGFAQIIFERLGKDLNNLIFRDTFRMIEEYATQYQFGKLKVSGLCWNAGNLAPLLTFGYIYTRNNFIRIAILILGFLSGSRTLMIGLIIATVIQVIISLNSKHKLSRKKAIFFLIGIGIFFIMVVANIDVIMEKTTEIIQLLDLKNRVKTEGSASTHLYYWTSIPAITQKNDLLSNLFGYGPGCSGYPQSHLMNFYATSDKWSIECDYVNQLWSYGYIGFAIYYYWYLKNVLKVMKIDQKYFVLFSVFLIEGAMYNITFNWVLFLIISIFLLQKTEIDIFNY